LLYVFYRRFVLLTPFHFVSFNRMTAVTQTMAASAAQYAAGSVVAGTAAGTAAGAAAAGGIFGAVTGAVVGVGAGVQAAVVVATAVAAASIATGVSVRLQTTGLGMLDLYPNVTDYDIYPGRLDIYFQGPLDPFTLEEGKDLTDQLVGIYNGYFGCESVYNRLMLNSTKLRCEKSEDACCRVVDTEDGPRLLCEFETSSHCAILEQQYQCA
jgi:hypothetical protein